MKVGANAEKVQGWGEMDLSFFTSSSAGSGLGTSPYFSFDESPNSSTYRAFIDILLEEIWTAFGEAFTASHTLYTKTKNMPSNN